MEANPTSGCTRSVSRRPPRLGADGVALHHPWLGKRLEGRRAPVKEAILDQRTVAGLGNIYADEALWRAGIHPLRPAGELDGDEIQRLRRAIRAALLHGLARQGGTLSDYRRPNGASGAMQHEFTCTAAAARRATAV